MILQFKPILLGFVFCSKFGWINCETGSSESDAVQYEDNKGYLKRLPTTSDRNCEKECESHERCCLQSNGEARCCPSQRWMDDNEYRRRQEERQRRMYSSSHRYPSFWNMWFVMIMLMAICFTGCNYWRRMRQLQLRHLLGAPYPFQTPLYNGGGRNSGVRANFNGQPQIIIPVTMFEINPGVMRMMAEQHLHDQQTTETGPPSYSEVARKREEFPPAYAESGRTCVPPDACTELPSYDAAMAQQNSTLQSNPSTHINYQGNSVTAESVAKDLSGTERVTTS